MVTDRYRLQVITCTGYRPEAWRFCQLLINHQTLSEFDWIIVTDDPNLPDPTRVRAGISYKVVQAPWEWKLGQNTLRDNLILAMNHVDHNRPVAFFEDDDHYAPAWLANALASIVHLGADLVGQLPCRKYNLRTRRAREFPTPGKSCLSATVLAGGSAIARFQEVLHEGRLSESGVFLPDMTLWKGFDSLKKDQLVHPYKTGIKGLPGRPGIDTGHKEDFGDIGDPEGGLLRRWVGREMSQRYLAIRHE